MPKCPVCGEEIDHLVAFATDVVECVVEVVDGRLMVTEVDKECGGLESFLCPKCDAELFKTLSDAEQFLKGGEM